MDWLIDISPVFQSSRVNGFCPNVSPEALAVKRENRSAAPNMDNSADLALAALLHCAFAAHNFTWKLQHFAHSVQHKKNFE
jgi:hypothetical protein